MRHVTVVREADIIPKGTSDERVLETLRERPPEILLIPFHAHRDQNGDGLNGIAIAERLAAARLRLSPLGSRPLSDDLRARILLIDESALDQPETGTAILHHVRDAG